MAKSLEEHLYKSAKSKEDYLDVSTLKTRLKNVAHGLELHRSTSSLGMNLNSFGGGNASPSFTGGGSFMGGMRRPTNSVSDLKNAEWGNLMNSSPGGILGGGGPRASSAAALAALATGSSSSLQSRLANFGSRSGGGLSRFSMSSLSAAKDIVDKGNSNRILESAIQALKNSNTIEKNNRLVNTVSLDKFESSSAAASNSGSPKNETDRKRPSTSSSSGDNGDPPNKKHQPDGDDPSATATTGAGDLSSKQKVEMEAITNCLTRDSGFDFKETVTLTPAMLQQLAFTVQEDKRRATSSGAGSSLVVQLQLENALRIEKNKVAELTRALTDLLEEHTQWQRRSNTQWQQQPSVQLLREQLQSERNKVTELTDLLAKLVREHEDVVGKGKVETSKNTDNDKSADTKNTDNNENKVNPTSTNDNDNNDSTKKATTA